MCREVSGTSGLTFSKWDSVSEQSLLLPQSSRRHYMATSSFSCCSGPKPGVTLIPPLLLSFPASRPSTNPVCSTFKPFLESDHFLPPPPLSPRQSSFALHQPIIYTAARVILLTQVSLSFLFTSHWPEQAHGQAWPPRGQGNTCNGGEEGREGMFAD